MKRREQVALTLMYVLFIYGVAMALTSCASSKSCHNNGHYVSKSVKKAQSKPRHY